MFLKLTLKNILFQNTALIGRLILHFASQTIKIILIAEKLILSFECFLLHAIAFMGRMEGVSAYFFVSKVNIVQQQKYDMFICSSVIN